MKRLPGSRYREAGNVRHRKETMNLVIRADGNSQIASGHLRRTLSIAEKLLERGCGVSYLLSDEESRRMLLAQLRDEQVPPERIGQHILGIPYGTPMREIRETADVLQEERADIFLVDSYAVDSGYFEELRKICGGLRIAFIDDLCRFDPPADLVVNYDPCPDASFYRKSRVRLLGPSYAPLRDQFTDIVPVVRQAVGQILITTGGTDPYGMADRIAEMISEDPVLAAVGGGSLRIRILGPGHGFVSNMAGTMRQSDLAVSAGGTTLYELCAAGVPAAAFAQSDDQVLFAGAMGRVGAVSYMGDVRTESGDVLERIRVFLRERAENEGLRRAESARMSGITDGRGASRIADALIGLARKNSAPVICSPNP